MQGRQAPTVDQQGGVTTIVDQQIRAVGAGPAQHLHNVVHKAQARKLSDESKHTNHGCFIRARRTTG
jgi:hypothetical protein